MRHLLDIAALAPDSLPDAARALARFSLFDWMVVARAGADEPVSRIIRDFVVEEGGRPVATVVSGATLVPARAAALANGTISHALDYDDTHFAHIGHLSVGIMPAALAAAEQTGASAIEVCDAFLVGAEAACRVGMVLGRRHYDRGFHQTATSGAFGATIAAGRLFGLSGAQMRNALGLVSTRASGLKSQFGTMGKPLNAGISASNGVEAASLAQRGAISCDDGIGGAQGFIETHTDEASEESAWAAPPPAHFVFEDIKYKLHACCHGAHAMINALLDLRARREVAPDSIARVVIRTNPRWLRVCDLKQPRTGLEAKFSYILLAAMVLHGIDTASDTIYSDALCRDQRLIDLAQLVQVEGNDQLKDTVANVTVELKAGEAIDIDHDLAAFLPFAQLENGLRAKARALLGEAEAEALWSGIGDIARLSARDLGQMLIG